MRKVEELIRDFTIQLNDLKWCADIAHDDMKDLFNGTYHGFKDAVEWAGFSVDYDYNKNTHIVKEK